MSENYKELKAVQQKIEDLLKRETALCQIVEPTRSETIELKGIPKMILNLEKDREFWQKLVEKENSQIAVKKPSIPFNKATLEDCMKSDGLALDLRYIEPFYQCTLHIPEDVQTPIASQFLCEHLLLLKKHFILNNEKACRMLIDALLLEVLKSEANEKLFGFCEVQNNWEGAGFGYTGNVDYMLGSSKFKLAENIDSFLLVVEAKKEWPDSAIPQVLCEAGCLLRRRLNAGKKTPVFAILTNGYMFRFFAIDTDGIVYASEMEILKAGQNGTYNSSSSLAEILRWFYWFMTSLKSISPRASAEKLTEDTSLEQLKSYFGPKNH